MTNGFEPSQAMCDFRLRRCVLFTLAFLALLGLASAQTFHFDTAWRDKKPERVYVVGTFNQWSADATPLSKDGIAFYASPALPDGEHAYRYRLVYHSGSEETVLDHNYPVYWPNKNGIVNHYLKIDDGEPIDPIGLETFVRSPHSGPVSIAGTFNDWRQDEIIMAMEPRRTFKKPEAVKPEPPGPNDEPPFVRKHKYLSSLKLWCMIKVDRPFEYRFVCENFWQNEEPDEAMGIIEVPNYLGQKNNRRIPILTSGIVRVDWTSPDPLLLELAAGRIPGGLDRKARLEWASQVTLPDDYDAGILVCRSDESGSLVNRESIHLEELLIETELHKRFADIDRANECRLMIVERFAVDERTAPHWMELGKSYIFDKMDGKSANELLTLLSERSTDPQTRAHAMYWAAWALYYGSARNVDWPTIIDVMKRAGELAPPPDPDNLESMKWHCEWNLSMCQCYWFAKDLENAHRHILVAKSQDIDPQSPQTIHIDRWIEWCEKFPHNIGLYYSEFPEHRLPSKPK